MSLHENQRPNRDIAVIGLAGRFPGARNVREFWQNLCAGKESVSFFSEEELEEEGLAPELVRDPAYVRAKGVVEDCDGLDAPFFKFSPKEAAFTDPQHRVFLECAWHALEDAGYMPESHNGNIGVFAGSNLNTYLLWNVNRTLPPDGSDLPFEVRIGNDKDYLTTRVSYKLGLKGPSVAIQTACSTSLIAVYTACQNLLRGDCDLALAGAVSITFPLKRGYLYHKEGMFPPDGHCRPFNACSEGCPDSDGVGVVVLKILGKAIADKDHIYAVIKGAAINNDGSLKVGFTAPSVERQAAVVRAALESAGVGPESISYIETHGTGTPLGDSIEIEALTEAFRSGTEKTGFCTVGSVKSNIGHLNVASGIAGLIKTVLALQQQAIPATLHFEKPNPHIKFASSPFRVAHAYTPWLLAGQPRRAGVSSFGIGGTNAHVILEEYLPQAHLPQAEDSWQLLPLSARTAQALDRVTDDLAEHLKQHSGFRPADVAYTLSVGRRSFNERRIVLGRTRDDLILALTAKNPKWTFSGVAKSSGRSVAFMFPGLGDHYLRMGHGLYQAEPVFRRHVDGCAAILRPLLDVDLRTVLYPEMPMGERSGSTSVKANPFKAMLERGPAQENPQEQTLNRTPHAHTALFVVEYALAQLLLEWGIRPKAMIGYSIGEYVAACLAGVIKLEDALSLVARRARLIETLPHGAMLAITLPADEVEPLLSGDVFLSALNGSSLSVVSGSTTGIARVEQEMKDRKIVCRRLSAEYPFHSKLMEPIAAQFTKMVEEIDLSPPRIPFLSNVTGTWITNELAVDPAYWGRHLSEKVLFIDGITTLVKDSKRVLLEVGPGNILSSIALQHLTGTDQDRAVLSSLGHRYDEEGDVPYLLRTLGKLWLNEVNVDWKLFHGDQDKRRVPLPGYPFERERYLLSAPRKETPASVKEQAVEDLLQKRPNLSDWFYFPSWKRTAPAAPWNTVAAINAPSNWLIFSDDCGIGADLTEKLRLSNQRVVVVRTGSVWKRKDDSNFIIDPENPQHMSDLLDHLAQANLFPRTIVHLWSTSPSAPQPGIATVDESQIRGFHSLSLLAQALAGLQSNAIHLAVVSSEVHAVTGTEDVRPEKATILGACKVIPQELPDITCANIDLVLPEFVNGSHSRTVDSLLAELNNRASGVIAFRAGNRWVRTIEPLLLPPAKELPAVFRSGGTCLITGGLGAIGLTLAEHLVRASGRSNLVLVGRTGFPPPETWPNWLLQHEKNDPVSEKIRRLQTLEQLGAQIMIATADVSDPVTMGSIVQEAKKRFGSISGVIHAAGVGGGSLMQLSSREMSEAILRPKKMGSLVLDLLLAGNKLDFFLVCSSISSFIGGLGMADHSAANAFLDSFAGWRTRTRSSYTVAINWDSWQLAGLAFAAANPKQSGISPLEDSVQKLDGPVFHQYQVDSAGRFVFSGVLNTSRQWLLDEHRILDRALVPGTGYLEMLREAAQHITGPGDLEIRDLVFIFPLFVADTVDTFLRLDIESTGTSFKFTFLSNSSMRYGSSGWMAHAEGSFSITNEEPLPQHDIAALLAKTDPRRTKAGVLPDSGPLYFGPRWQNLVTVYPGQDQSMALLELPAEFCSDLKEFCLHPALMDIATSFVIQGRGFYMPITYTKLRLRAPLTPRIYSLIACPETSFANSDIVTFNLTIMDTAGRELVAIEDFVMKRIPDAAQRLPGWTQGTGKVVEPSPDLTPVSQHPVMDQNNPFHRHLAQGILPAEGAEIFERILSRPDITQVVVSTVDFHAWSSTVDAYTTQPFAVNSSSAAIDAKEPESGDHRRPNLGIPFAAPRDNLESALTEFMQELLGIRSIGIDDNFFDLGGDSLKGVKLLGLLRNKLSLGLSLKALYSLPTVRAIAEHHKNAMQEAAT